MTDAEPDARLRLGLLAALLALALVLHQLWWDGVEVRSWHGAVVLAAFVVLARPTSVPRLVALLGLEVVAVARDMPGAGSHTVLLAVCAATVLAHVAVGLARTRRLPDAGALLEQIAPFLRAAVLVLYVSAALAKMNSGFFDPAVSCAAKLSAKVAWWDPALLQAHWLGVAAIYGSLATECALPFLLGFRRTRPLGLALGVGFHLVLAFAGNVPFTSLLFALYVAFLPPGALARALPAWRPPRGAGTALVAGLCGLWLAGSAAASAHHAGARVAIGDGTRFAVLAVVLAGAALAVRGLRSRGAARVSPAGALRVASSTLAAVPSSGGSAAPSLAAAPPVLQRTRLVFAAGLALLVLNAASPYLGWKTESSFTMFSNLQTEGSDWNHAFIPEQVRIFGDQAHLVTVTASNDPGLLRRTSHGTRMVRFELERYLRLHHGTWATVDGRRLTEPRGGLPIRLLDRVAKFRDVRAEDQRGC